MSYQVIQGDCIEQMAKLEEASVDAIVTDPPYELSFMGKGWDSTGVAYQPATWAAALRVLKPGGHLLAFGGSRTFHRLACAVEDAGFEIRDTILNVRGGDATEPSGLLAWIYGSGLTGFPKSLNVTKALEAQIPAHEQCACAQRSTQTTEDSPADCPSHLRSDDAQPLPAQGDDLAAPPSPADAPERNRVGRPQDGQGARPANSAPDAASAHLSSADSSRPSEHPPAESRAFGSKPSGTSSSTSPDELKAERRTEHRTPGTSRSASDSVSSSPLRNVNLPRCPDCNGYVIPQGYGTALKPAHEPIVVARKPLIGTVAQNVLEHGTGALNVDGCRVEHDDDVDLDRQQKDFDRMGYMGTEGGTGGVATYKPGGRWPANVVLGHTEDCGVIRCKRCDAPETYTGPALLAECRGGHDWALSPSCAPGCAAAELDEQSGKVGGSTGGTYRGAVEGWGLGRKEGNTPNGYDDVGGASRFFYVAKTSRAERNAGLEGFEERETAAMQGNLVDGQRLAGDGSPIKTPLRQNVHPTVKPINLMRWLVRLVTPPNGLVLDPFLGSGTTGCAAVLEDFDFIGIEREAEYVAIAEARIKHWYAEPVQLGLEAA